MTKINLFKTQILTATTLVAAFVLLWSVQTGSASVTISALQLDANAPTTLVSSDSQITVSVPADPAAPQLFASLVDLAGRDQIAGFFSLPTGLSALTDAYFLRLNQPGEVPYATDNQITIAWHYSASAQMPVPHYYDWANLRFAPASSTYDAVNKTISFTVPLTDRGHVLFALFGASEQVGTASWYVHPRYPTELMAASVDFPFGTKLRVTNPANGKSVVVTVKDYGPNKSIHPDRVIDLSKVAFAQIASTSAGVIKVIVIPVDHE